MAQARAGLQEAGRHPVLSCLLSSLTATACSGAPGTLSNLPEGSLSTRGHHSGPALWEADPERNSELLRNTQRCVKPKPTATSVFL